MGYLLGVGSSCSLLFHEVISLYPLHFDEMIFTLVPLIFFRLGQRPGKKNKLCSCAHTYTCTFTACVYTSPCTRTFTCMRAQAHQNEHNRNMRRHSVCARTCPPGWPASNTNGVVLCLLWWTSRSTAEICSWRKTIAWCLCTPLATLETLGGKIITCTCSSKEITGLKKNIMMTWNSWIRVWPFSRVENWWYELVSHMYS